MIGDVNFTDPLESYRKIMRGLNIMLNEKELGTGTSPYTLVLQEDDVKVLHYTPRRKQVYKTPILFVYALVNRYYILDLQPDKSVVKKLLDDGFDVFIVDWGYPSGIDRFLTLEDYINGYMNDAIDKVIEITGSEKINLVGVCQGGTLSVIYSTLHPEKIRNLVTVVTPVDFDTDQGLLNIWAKNMDVDKVVDHYGIVPGDFLNYGFLLTDPMRVLIDKYVGLFDKLHCEPNDENCKIENEQTIDNFLRMEKWIYDSPDQAGEAYRQFIKDFYQKNLLIQNKFKLDGTTIDHKKIEMPLLNVMAKYDHLVPNDSSLPLNRATSSKDHDTLVFPTGHIGIFVGTKSQNEVCPKIAGWLGPRSEPMAGKKSPERGSKGKPGRPKGSRKKGRA